MHSAQQLLELSVSRVVPYHNTAPDAFFFGNSVVGASGLPNGDWTFLIGPDYTSPNYIQSEKLSFCAGDDVYSPDLQMKRLRGSGVFFGTAETDGFRIAVWDFAPPESPLLLRRIRVTDSTGCDRKCTVRAEILPFEADTETAGTTVHIRKDTTRYCYGWETINWADRFCDISFREGGSLTEDDGKWILSASLSDDNTCTLMHRCYYADDPVPDISSSAELLEDTLDWWKNWFDAGKLPDIPDKRDADALESLLLCVKMQQNRDGGAIAGIRRYANSYIRDTHGCMRLFLASGHTAEVEKLLYNIHTRWKIRGFIPNWWSMGSDSFIGDSFNNNVSEITAYYLFMARDYLAHTGNRELIETILPSLTWAAHAQLDWLRQHDYTMDFNGDETEQYCCNRDGEEYGGFHHPEYLWNHKALSFTSMTAALSSLEWYADYTGEDLSADCGILRKRIDEIFLNPAEGTHIWNAVPTENGWQHHKGQMTNYLLLPLWIRAELPDGGEKKDALAVRAFVREDGFLPNCPQIMQGFCGHTMGLFLYDMLRLGETETAERAARTILDSHLLSMYGTVSEFYGPSCVPNGHMCRGFEGGIVGEALVRYFESL